MKIETLINNGVINDIHDNPIVVVTPEGITTAHQPDIETVECEEVTEEVSMPPLRPLPWGHLFASVAGTLTEQQVTSRLKYIYQNSTPFYLKCTEEEFLACFGLPNGSQPAPIMWFGNARALNYFIKRLYYPGRVHNWNHAAQLFVQDDGTPYTSLKTQELRDKKEIEDIENIFKKKKEAKTQDAPPK